MSSITSNLRYFAIVLFVSKLSYGYQSLQRVTERLDTVEEEMIETSKETSQDIQDLKEALRQESRFRREDVKALYEVLKKIQGANITGSVADIKGHEDVNTCTTLIEGETTSKDNSLVLLFNAFMREKQNNVHLRNELINIQNKLEEKIANLSEETVENVAGEISALLKFKDRLNDNVTVVARGIEERIMSHLNQEKSTMRTVISEVIVDLTAINDSFIDGIERCFQEISNHTKKLNNLSLKVSHKHSACNQVISKPGQVHDIYLKELKQIIPVFCDFDIDGEGWFVFQRRKYGSEDFNRLWEEYKLGFGDLKGDFWWGNENLHLMTMGEPRELRIDIEDFDGNKTFAKYSSFRIRSEEQNYKLEVGGYSGSAGNALNYNLTGEWIHDGQEFSTRDRDNDNISPTNCAKSFRGGWWFNACFAANLNGQFFGEDQDADKWQGILWYTFSEKSLKFAEMKFR